MREVERKLDWSRVQMWPGEMPKEIERQLEAAGVKMERLKKSVYVIRLNGKFCIRYPKGDPSPVIYIGRGDFSTRVRHHRRFWLGELEDLVGDFCFDIRIATPRVQNSPDAYKDCEAYMIRTFGDQFGSLPLWNKKKEPRTHLHYVYDFDEVMNELRTGSGKRYHWALEPLPSSGFHEVYHRTHTG